MRPRPAFLTVLACLLLAGLALLAQQPPAAQAPPAAPQQPGQVTLEINRGLQARKIKIAFPAFRGQTGGPGQELEQTVRHDLDLSGYFEIQGPDALSGLALSGDVQKDLAAYRSTGNEVLLLGDMRMEGDKLVFEGRVLDLGSGQAVLAKRYSGPSTVSRRMAHTFADEVIRFLAGKPGIALSEIAFTSDRGGSKEIWAMDYDGANQRRITSHRSTSMSPAWSPNGESLAYTSFFNGPPGIYIAEIGSGRQPAGSPLGLVQHQPQLRTRRPAPHLRQVDGGERRDLHRRPRGRQPAAADQF